MAEVRTRSSLLLQRILYEYFTLHANTFLSDMPSNQNSLIAQLTQADQATLLRQCATEIDARMHGKDAGGQTLKHFTSCTRYEIETLHQLLSRNGRSIECFCAKGFVKPVKKSILLLQKALDQPLRQTYPHRLDSYDDQGLP
jgi:hypothetical protein